MQVLLEILPNEEGRWFIFAYPKIHLAPYIYKNAHIYMYIYREDLDSSEAGRDVLIKKAWDTRDAAVKRKNNTEIELAKTRIDVMQVFRLAYI